MKQNGKRISILLALAAFGAMLLGSDAALTGAQEGVSVCARVIIPGLLPCLILAGLLTRLGIPALLVRFLTPVTSRLFRVSGAGAAAFVLGVSGGYPLGAATVAELRRQGEISPEEGSRLLGFCNNSGPAFLVGAIGAGVFHSTRLGLLLYGAHVLAAALTGVLLARLSHKPYKLCKPKVQIQAIPLSQAFTAAAAAGAEAMVRICAFVVFFAAAGRVLWQMPGVAALPLALHDATGIPLQAVRALFQGLLELGSGAAALSGMPLSPASAALAAFLAGWGGVSVIFQTLAVTAGTETKAALHLAGRLCTGLISAGIVYGVLCFPL